MWIFMKDAFLSIVEDRTSRAGDLLVRARAKGDIERVFPLVTVRKTGGSDYAFRSTISRATVCAAIAHQLSTIGYDNFKDSVEENDRHTAYLSVWHTMRRFQDVRTITPKTKKRGR